MGVQGVVYEQQTMNDGSSPEGTGPEHCCRDLGTCQSPMPCEMPVWVGTVPNGCSLLQDTPRIPGECLQAVAAPELGQLESKSGTWGRKQSPVFPLFFHVNVTLREMTEERKMLHYVAIAHTCGKIEMDEL